MPRKRINRRFHSRLVKTEQRRNLIRLFVFGTLSLGLLILILSGGLSALANLAFFVGQPGNPEATPTPAPVFLSAPILAPLPSATNSAQIKLTGFSQKETSIEIFLNEESQNSLETNQDGQFEKILTLQEGENHLYVVAQDFLGNYSNPSDKIKIVFDQEPPELEIESPQDSEKIFQEKNQTIQIKGHTEANASLYFGAYDKSSSAYFNDHLLVLNSEGEFSTQLKLREGENHLRFLARDPAGNETEKEIKVFYQP